MAALEERVLAEFDVDRPTLEADLAALIAQLLEQQLIIVTT